MKRSDLKEIIKEEILKEASERQIRNSVIGKLEDALTYLDYVPKTVGFEPFKDEAYKNRVNLEKLLRKLKGANKVLK